MDLAPKECLKGIFKKKNVLRDVKDLKMWLLAVSTLVMIAPAAEGLNQWECHYNYKM